MSYHYVVCVKQVPDTKNITAQAMKEDGTVNRAALPAIFNPDDLHALEMALSVRDQLGGTVTVVTMGLPKACAVLREALYRGADRVILITDRRAAGSDTLATSYILSCAIRRLAPVDLVFCGRQAIDGDTAQVGPQLAEKLNYTLVSYAEQIVALDPPRLRLRRNLGHGWELVEAQLPVLLTVPDSANVPRPPAARRLMKFKKARAPAEIEAELAAAMPQASPHERAQELQRRCQALEAQGLLITQWNLDDLGADPARCGLAGSPTKVHRVQSIVLAGGSYKEFPPTDEGVAALVAELIRDRILG